LNTVSSSFRKVLLEGSRPFDYVNKSAFSKEAIEKMNQALKNNTPPKPLAELHTIHGSKGLEWDNVIIFDGITRKIDKMITRYRTEFENECRVWYVGFTRARQYLVYVTADVFPLGLNKPFVGGGVC
jgi:ATP-dependent exoDNAse (exonuclease V) beta subunit